MAKTFGKLLIAPQVAPREPQQFAQSVVNKGMFTVGDPADIPDAGWTLALNARCRYDRTARRSGKSANSIPAAPDPAKILKIFLFKKNDGNTYWLRITRGSIYKRNSASWTAFTAGTGGSLAGTDNDRMDLAVVLNKLFLANGVDQLQEIDVNAFQYKVASATLTSAPKVKFVTGFFNRVVGAYDTDPGNPNGPVSLIWSADGDTTLWPADASPDVSSGQSPLVESPGDLADFISGVFGFTNLMIVPRERSIWLVTKQPVASAPFNAFAAFPGIGSDCPRSIAVIPNGIVFCDTRTSTVWAYEAGGQPERIGLNVEADLIKSINDNNQVFGEYHSKHNEYMVSIPVPNSTIVRTWVYNFRNKAWTRDEDDGNSSASLSTISDITSPFSVNVSFDELVGTFDALSGSFDALGAAAPRASTLTFGFSDGSVLEESDSTDTDVVDTYTTELQSKDFVFPEMDMYVSEIKIEYKAAVSGTITLEYSKDSGVSWTTAKTIQTDLDSKIHFLRFVKNIKTRRLRWRIKSSSGLFDIFGYEVLVYPGPKSRK